jgi:hypothetical protein
MLNQAKLAPTSTGPPPLDGLAISAERRTTSVSYSQTSRHISEWLGLGWVGFGLFGFPFGMLSLQLLESAGKLAF